MVGHGQQRRRASAILRERRRADAHRARFLAHAARNAVAGVDVTVHEQDLVLTGRVHRDGVALADHRRQRLLDAIAVVRIWTGDAPDREGSVRARGAGALLLEPRLEVAVGQKAARPRRRAVALDDDDDRAELDELAGLHFAIFVHHEPALADACAVATAAIAQAQARLQREDGVLPRY